MVMKLGYTNDYSYLNDPGKSYDNRWMHRPVIDWEKNKKINKKGSVEQRIFSGTQQLIALRKKLPVVADHSNLAWMTPHNIHVAGFVRSLGDDKLFGVFNFNSQPSFLTWYAFKEQDPGSRQSYLIIGKQKTYDIGEDHDYLVIEPYGFLLLEPVKE